MSHFRTSPRYPIGKHAITGIKLEDTWANSSVIVENKNFGISLSDFFFCCGFYWRVNKSASIPPANSIMMWPPIAHPSTVLTAKLWPVKHAINIDSGGIVWRQPVVGWSICCSGEKEEAIKRF